MWSILQLLRLYYFPDCSEGDISNFRNAGKCCSSQSKNSKFLLKKNRDLYTLLNKCIIFIYGIAKLLFIPESRPKFTYIPTIGVPSKPAAKINIQSAKSTRSLLLSELKICNLKNSIYY